jgi:hypothetical protein
MQNTFVSRVQALSFAKKAKTSLEWLTLQQVKDRHGTEEGLAMIKDGSFMARKNPQNPRFWQFCGRSDSVEVSVEHMQSMRATASDKLTAAQFAAISDGMKSLPLQDTDDLNAGLEADIGDDTFDDGDKDLLPPSLLEKLFGTGGPKTPKVKTSQVQQLEVALQQGKVSKVTAKGKVRTMHSTMGKLVLALKGEWHSFSVSLTGKASKAKAKAYKDTTSALSKHNSELEKFLVEAHMGEKEVKELLVHCVAEYKIGCALLEEMKAAKE